MFKYHIFQENETGNMGACSYRAGNSKDSGRLFIGREKMKSITEVIRWLFNYYYFTNLS